MIWSDTNAATSRYEPLRAATSGYERLLAKLAEHRLVVESSAAFGMQPRSSRLVDLGMWWLINHRERAMWWYNEVFMSLGLWCQKKLQLVPGMIPTDDVDEILLVCRVRPETRA